MKHAGLFLGSTLLAMTAFVSAGTGCGGDGTGGTGGSTTGTGGSTTTTTTTTTTTGTGGMGGSPATCADYCTQNLANCKDANKQWPSEESCLAACATFPAGMPSDMAGNSLACRAYHTGAAASDAATHCNHAGPIGGDNDPTDAAGGPCGEGCEAFCAIALAVCTGSNVQYADAATCMTDCKTFKANATPYSTADTSTNDFGCRMYHLSVAATDAASADTHCGHIKSSSPVCTN
jgi:hypothetical protein